MERHIIRRVRVAWMTLAASSSGFFLTGFLAALCAGKQEEVGPPWGTTYGGIQILMMAACVLCGAATFGCGIGLAVALDDYVNCQR